MARATIVVRKPDGSHLPDLSPTLIQLFYSRFKEGGPAKSN
jgi:hypothetical protein